MLERPLGILVELEGGLMMAINLNEPRNETGIEWNTEFFQGEIENISASPGREMRASSFSKPGETILLLQPGIDGIKPAECILALRVKRVVQIKDQHGAQAFVL